jgi:hypothetical protein
MATEPPALPEVVVLSGHDLAVGEVDERGALFVLPVVSEADSPRTREGIARRRLGALSGACPCGARLVLPNRAQRRAVTRRGDRARIAHVAVEHEDDCPAIDPYCQGGSW